MADMRSAVAIPERLLDKVDELNLSRMGCSVQRLKRTTAQVGLSARRALNRHPPADASRHWRLRQVRLHVLALATTVAFGRSVVTLTDTWSVGSQRSIIVHVPLRRKHQKKALEAATSGRLTRRRQSQSQRLGCVPLRKIFFASVESRHQSIPEPSDDAAMEPCGRKRGGLVVRE